MALHLVKYSQSLSVRFSGNVCCALWGTLFNNSVPLITIKKCLVQRFIVSHTNVPFQNELDKFNRNKCSKPVFLENDRSLPKNNSDDFAITSEDIALIKNTETDVLAPCKEDVSDIGPFASAAFHLAAYVNSSFTLQQFVHMGVQLHIIERKEGVAESLLKLDFDRDVKPYLRFLHDIGVPADEFGKFVTKNPWIFQQYLDDLRIRINYLEAKHFTNEAISRIVTRNPVWLNFSTVDIDKRLGFYQRTFILSGDEVRAVAMKRPTLITYPLGKVAVSHFAVREEMGFSEIETKELLLKAPKIFNIQTKALTSRFDLIHNVMGISHEHILEQPTALLFREFIVKQRHEFLKELGRAQYDPKLPNYVSLDKLVHGSDVDFCRDVAKASIEVFNTFLKAK